MSAGFNLAILSPAEKQAMNADRVACFLLHYKATKGKEWRAWAESELMKMPNQEQVRIALNLRLGSGK